MPIYDRLMPLDRNIYLTVSETVFRKYYFPLVSIVGFFQFAHLKNVMFWHSIILELKNQQVLQASWMLAL